MKLTSIAKYCVILSIVPAVYISLFPSKIVLITVICCYPITFLLVNKILTVKKMHLDSIIFLNLFILYNLVILIRGVVDASSFKDWANLATLGIPVFVFLPLTIFLGMHNPSLRVSFRSFVYVGVFISLILFFKDSLGMYDFAHCVSPVYILIIFIPYLQIKYKYTIVILALCTFFSDLTVRSNLLNIIIATTISLTYLVRKFRFSLIFIKSIRLILIIAPLLFLFLAISGVFNVFKIGELMGEFVIDAGQGKSQDLLVDSRTSIYTDVFTQLDVDSSYLFGLGGSGKTKTSLTDITYADYDIIYKEGRRATESGMLNYIQWGGIFGGIVYFALFIKASYLAIYKSNNWLCVMIGLWTAFKGLFSFIEDSLVYNIYSIFIFIAIGMCLNRELRMMTNSEIRDFLNNIFLLKQKFKINKMYKNG